MKNLWAKVGIVTENKSYPVKALEAQGKHLEEMTNQVLTYRINTTIIDEWKATKSGRAYLINFYIHAPHIDDYSFLLLYVIHDFLDTFPLHIGTFRDEQEATIIADNPQEFESILAEILGSEKTQHIINTLYTRSQPQPV